MDYHGEYYTLKLNKIKTERRKLQYIVNRECGDHAKIFIIQQTNNNDFIIHRMKILEFDMQIV